MIEVIGDHLPNVLIVIVSVLYFIAYGQVASKSLFYLTSFLLLTCIIQLTTAYFSYNGWNNLFLSHIYFIGQFVLMSLFYSALFNNKQKRFVQIMLVIVLGFLAIHYVDDSTLLMSFDVIEIFVTSSPIVIYTIIYLYNSLTKRYHFDYINGALLIYLSVSTLIFILGDYISNTVYKETIGGIYSIHAVIYILFLITTVYQWKINYLVKRQES